jgi:hypothetical protein
MTTNKNSEIEHQDNQFEFPIKQDTATQQDVYNQKPKCPTCNRIISKNIHKFSITEFHRKIRNVMDIDSLNAIKEYILRVIKYYHSQDVYLKFADELKRQTESVDKIDNIKEWILTYLMNSPEPLKIRGLSQMRNSSLITKLRAYLIAEYIDNNNDLNEPFSQFYNNFNCSIAEVDKENVISLKPIFSKQSVSRALKALGIKTGPKKIDNKTCICICISNQELRQCLSYVT